MVLPGDQRGGDDRRAQAIARGQLDAEDLLDGELQQIGPSEWIMYKPRWGAFYRTSLEEHLRDLGANTIVVWGCNFPNCPRATVYKASERDLRIAFVPDATSGVYEWGLRELENIGVKLASVDELSQKLTAEFRTPDIPASYFCKKTRP